MTDPGLVGIEAGQKRSAGWAATASVIKLRKAETVGSELIEIGSVDFSAVTSDVGEAHVIRHYNDDIRLFSAEANASHAAEQKIEELILHQTNLLNRALKVNDMILVLFECGRST